MKYLKITGRIEITYQLLNKETADVYMTEQLDKFKTHYVEFEQYLAEVGGYGV